MEYANTMTATLGGRIVSALLLVLLLARPASTGSAASRSGAATACRESAAIPQREFRLLSRREIFQAIQNHLAQMGISGRGGLRPGDLNIQSSVPVLIVDIDR